MAFDKIIISQIVKVAKNSAKLKSAVSSAKEKLIDKASSEIEKNIPIPLPFTPKELILNPSSAQNLLTPETLSKAVPIPDALKPPISSTLDKMENSLNQSIQTKNKLQAAVSQVTQPLNIVESTTSSLNGMLSGIDAAITIIKAIPIPTAVAGVGIPSSLIIGFSDNLATLKDIVKQLKGAVGIVGPISNQIKNMIVPINVALLSLDKIYPPITQIIVFIRTLLLFGPNATQEQIDQTLSETLKGITESIATSGDSSNLEVNQLSEELLISRLQANSNDPLFYKDYKLEIQYDPYNVYSFSSRRIKGTHKDNNLTLYNLQTLGYSFSSSVQVLIDEIKFIIDTIK